VKLEPSKTSTASDPELVISKKLLGSHKDANFFRIQTHCVHRSLKKALIRKEVVTLDQWISLKNYLAARFYEGSIKIRAELLMRLIRKRSRTRSMYKILQTTASTTTQTFLKKSVTMKIAVVRKILMAEDHRNSTEVGQIGSVHLNSQCLIPSNLQYLAKFKTTQKVTLMTEL